MENAVDKRQERNEGARQDHQKIQFEKLFLIYFVFPQNEACKSI